MVEKAEEKKLSVSISILRGNGYILFQYGSDGTQLLNQIWMEKKYHAVQVMGESSLASYYNAEITHQSPENHGLKDKMAFGPGGFPVNIRNTGIVAVIAVSGLPGCDDHDFIIECLTEYLNAVDVPMLIEAD